MTTFHSIREAAELLGFSRQKAQLLTQAGVFQNAHRRNPLNPRSHMLIPLDDITAYKVEMAGSVETYDAPHLTTRELESYLKERGVKFSRSWIKYAIREGYFPNAYKDGSTPTSRLRIPVSDAEAFIQKGEEDARTPRAEK